MALSCLCQRKCSVEFGNVCKCALWEILWVIFMHLYVRWRGGSDVTEGRCFLHGFEDDWVAGGMVQRQGKTPFLPRRVDAFFQGRLQPRRSRCCTASGLAATLEMGALFYNRSRQLQMSG